MSAVVAKPATTTVSAPTRALGPRTGSIMAPRQSVLQQQQARTEAAPVSSIYEGRNSIHLAVEIEPSVAASKDWNSIVLKQLGAIIDSQDVS